MFGDDPDTTVTTARVGSGTIFGRVRGEVRELTREVRLDLAVGSELCRRSRAEEEKRGRPGNSFWRPKTSDVLTGYYCRYIYPLGYQTNSERDDT